MNKKQVVLNTHPLCFWEFSEKGDQTSQGRESYVLRMSGDIQLLNEGIFSDTSLHMEEGKYFFLPRSECPKLDFSGDGSSMTIIAWVKRSRKEQQECQAVAGIWNETQRLRQYCLFLDLRIWNSGGQVCGHVSDTGGPTKGFKYCMDAAVGQKEVPYAQWRMIAFSYDGKEAKCYLDGRLDERPERNPYCFNKPLFSPGSAGADFTVGGVHRKGEMGNWYTGLLGGLAVYDRVVPAPELELINRLTLSPAY